MADTHLFHADLDVPAGDVLVHAGDLLRGGTLRELERGAEFLASLPHRHVLFVAGNHERCFESRDEEARALLPPNVTYLCDAGATIDGVRFWGSPWQPEFHAWAFNLPRGAALAQKWSNPLCIAYGQLGRGDPNAQLATAEGWLSVHKDNPWLLLTLGVLGAQSNQKIASRPGGHPHFPRCISWPVASCPAVRSASSVPCR